MLYYLLAKCMVEECPLLTELRIKSITTTISLIYIMLHLIDDGQLFSIMGRSEHTARTGQKVCGWAFLSFFVRVET
jgi:hypothetical protein